MRLDVTQRPLRGFPSLMDVILEQLEDGVARRRFSSVDLVKVILSILISRSSRIKEVNGILNAVTEFNPDAYDIAAQLDAERASQRNNKRSPPHGIPIIVKNNIATADKMNNTAGSFSLLKAKVPADSTVAKKLREAGIIILGKANMNQWAGFRSKSTNNGWSAHGGQTFGAYYQKQDPCGSSSGSGVVSSINLSFATRLTRINKN
ncbi:amidase signature enzyme [Tothia fuscella]|uniref:Amidase signature enzyme n=1 Tax=Tothia fuscella TaxID=1048955 RepID=A0A9P4TX03_9PEZI|nr:amidase signature enzyme [Tothia fuscella]